MRTGSFGWHTLITRNALPKAVGAGPEVKYWESNVLIAASGSVDRVKLILHLVPQSMNRVRPRVLRECS